MQSTQERPNKDPSQDPPREPGLPPNLNPIDKGRGGEEDDDLCD
jgi:hypothetical protein